MILKKNMVFKLLIIFLLFYGCDTKIDKKTSKYHLETKATIADTNTLILKGVNFYNTKSGKTSWNLKANSAKINKKKNIANLDKVKIIFRKENLNITSNKGLYNLKTKNGKLLDNVLFKGLGWEINTKEALFFNSDKKIVINTPFTFKGKNFLLKGSKLTALIEGKKFFIKGRVFSKWSE